MTSILKIISVFVILCLGCAGLFSMQGTLAYVRDTETSPANTLEAGSVDLARSILGLDPEAIASNLTPGDTVIGSVTLENVGNLEFQYSGWMEQKGGDDFLCQQLMVNAKLEGVNQYSGSLQVFNFATSTFTGTSTWTFDVFLPADPPAGIENMSCEFAFVFGARQLGSVAPGFNDGEEANFVVKSGTWIPKLLKEVEENTEVESIESSVPTATTTPSIIQEESTNRGSSSISDTISTSSSTPVQ